MDFRQLQYILAAAEHQSITKAAAALYISQPSLSHLIAHVEEELGARLFDRSAVPLKLTYAGEQYVKYAREILRLNDQMRREFRDISGSLKGRLRIGIPNERAAYMLPLIMPHFKALYPGIEIGIEIYEMSRLIDELRRGHVDFCILPDVGTELTDFGRVEIYSEKLVLVTGAEMVKNRHLLNGRDDTVDPAKLSDLPLIASSPGHALFQQVRELMEQQGITPATVFSSSSNIAALRLATAGLGVCIVPEMTLKLARLTQNPKIYMVGDPPFCWSVAFFYRRDSYIGTVEKAFFDTAIAAFATQTSRNAR